MDGLVDAVAAALAVGDAAEAGAGQEADAAGDDAGLVADDVAKEVAGDDDAVERRGLLDQDHGGAVNELVLHRQVGKLALKRLRHDAAPQPARGQHIGLVERPNPPVAPAPGQEASQTRDALHLGARVGLHVPSGAGAVVVLLAVAKVDAARELAHNDDVGAAAHVGLEGRRVDERVGREEARPQVPVRAHFLAQLEDPLLRPHRARAPFRAPDGAQEHRRRRLGRREGLVA